MSRRWLIVSALLGWCLFAEQTVAVALDQVKASARRPGLMQRYDDMSEMEGSKELERLCAEKVAMTIPLIAVPIADLAVGQITLHTEAGYYTVLLPVTLPQSKMKTLYWGADTLDEVMTFVQLLQDGRLLAVKAEAYSFEFRAEEGKRLTSADLRSCGRDQVKDLLEFCKECLIVEWVFKGRN